MKKISTEFVDNTKKYYLSSGSQHTVFCTIHLCITEPYTHKHNEFTLKLGRDYLTLLPEAFNIELFCDMGGSPSTVTYVFMYDTDFLLFSLTSFRHEVLATWGHCCTCMNYNYCITLDSPCWKVLGFVSWINHAHLWRQGIL